MIVSTLLLSAVTSLAAPPVTPLATPAPTEGLTVQGERLDPALYGRGVVETMEEVLRRDRENPPPAGVRLVPEPENPWRERIEREKREAAEGSDDSSGTQNLGGGGTTPVVGTTFEGPAIGGPGGGWIPPDTCGAVGPTHFVAITNAKITMYDKTTGAQVMNVGQSSFWGTGSTLGDGRAAYDPHSGRFILLSEDFSSRLYLAVSMTSNPTGSWFKTNFVISTGTDAGHWPDYPTLGVDANGIYSAAYMVGGANTMSIFAVDKAPLVSGSPSLGTVTAFRGLNWEGAIHPCITFGNPVGEYLVSRPGNNSQRLYRVNPPLNSPSLTNLGTYAVTGNSSPPNAPQQSGGNLDTLDARLMNAVYRNGSVWTTNCVAASGRAGVRWYEVDPAGPSQVQSGLIDDPVLYYYAPGISVNAAGDMVVGFSGSHSAQFASCYVSGRKSTDPSGQTGIPVLYKAGEGVDNDGRFGDYSLTTVDPNGVDFWTIQEYGKSGSWATYIAQVSFNGCAAIPPTNFCVTSANTAGPGAMVTSFGSTSVSANDFVLQTFGLPPYKTCLHFYGMNTTVLFPLGNGFRCLGSPFYRLPITTSDTFGVATLPVDLNDLPASGPIQAGETWGFQCWYRDPMAPGATTNVSDGLETHWCP